MRASAGPDRNNELVMLKPYYEQDGITLYNADSYALATALGHFDLLLTDPPYGIGVCNQTLGNGQKKFHKGNWDHAAPELSPFIGITRYQCIWGGNYFSDQLSVTNDWLIWDKKNPNLPFSEAELAWTNFKCQTRIKSHHWGGEKKRHPTMKPLSLMSWCINKAPSDVESVFDPFAGSGTTLVASKLAGVECVGCERDEVYCEIAADRLRQGVLF